MNSADFAENRSGEDEASFADWLASKIDCWNWSTVPWRADAFRRPRDTTGNSNFDGKAPRIVGSSWSITIEVPDAMMLRGGGTDKELGGAVRLVTAILWYQQGRISQGNAAGIAGMNRVVFLNALHEAGVEA